MLVQIAPGNARSRYPENPIQNKPVVLRPTPAARPALNYKWLQTSPFLIAHQTPDQNSPHAKATLNQKLSDLGIPFVNTS